MKKPNFFKRPVLYILAAFLLAAVIYSCKKDRNLTVSQVQTNQSLESNETLIAIAKTFFDSDVNKSFDPAQSVGKTQRQLLKKVALFDSARVQQFSFGKGVVVPLNYAGNDISTSVGNNYLSVSTMTNLLIYQDSQQKMHAEVVTRVPNADYVNDNSINKKFSGMVSVEDWQGNYLRGYAYKNGEVTGELGPPSESTQPVAKVNDTKKANDLRVCITLYWYQKIVYDDIKTKKANDYWKFIYTTTDCFTIFLGGGSGNGGGGGGGSNGPAPTDYPELIHIEVDENGCPIDSPPSSPYNHSIDGKKVNIVTGNDPCSLRKIINMIKDPCLRDMVNDAISNDVVYEVGQSMDGIFNTNTNFNLTFNDAILHNSDGSINYTTDGGTRIVNIKRSNDPGMSRIILSMDLQITLNTAALANASKEFVTATILHEALHSYFRSVGTIDDHDVMVNEYIPWFEAALRNIYPLSQYPQLDDGAIQALAYGGLTDTMAFSISGYSTSATFFNTLNQLYKNGSSGTPCHH